MSKKKKNKRNNSKYPALNKGVNLLSRRDYIEPEYVDGVYNTKGELVIPPLDEESKQFLNDFYEETIVTNFLRDPELRELNKKKNDIVNCSTVKELKQELKQLKKKPKDNSKKIKEISELITVIKKQNKELNEDEIQLIEDKMQDIREKVLLYPDKEDHKKFYNDNNSRNSCILNRMKMIKKLDPLTYQDHKSIDIHEYNPSIDYENDIINELEREKYDLEEERLKKVLEEENLEKSFDKSKNNSGNSTN